MLRGSIIMAWAICSTHAFAVPAKTESPLPDDPPLTCSQPSDESWSSAAAQKPDLAMAEAPAGETDGAPDRTAAPELAMRACNTWLLYPSKAFCGANSLHDDPVVTFLKRGGTSLQVRGERVKRVLAEIFNPDAATCRFAVPEVRIEDAIAWLRGGSASGKAAGNPSVRCSMRRPSIQAVAGGFSRLQ